MHPSPHLALAGVVHEMTVADGVATWHIISRDNPCIPLRATAGPVVEQCATIAAGQLVGVIAHRDGPGPLLVTRLEVIGKPVPVVLRWST